MSILLTVVVVAACCAAGGVPAAATPVLFNLHDDYPHLGLDALPSPASGDSFPRGEVRGSSPLTFSDSVQPPHPQPPSLPRSDVAFGAIVFPGASESGGGGSEGPGEIASLSDAASAGVLIYPNGPGLNRRVTALESACEVYNNLTTLYNGVLWTLLAQGQCPEGEWAVLGAECQPECRPRPCEKGQLEYQGKCVDLADPGVCGGGGQILYLDVRGDTFCECDPDSFYWKGLCYARRQRGPCDFGFFLEVNEQGEVDCMPNECTVDDFEKHEGTGRCYRKDFIGYCQDKSLDFHHNNLTVSCLILDVRNLFDRAITPSCWSGSRADHLGNCRAEVVMPSVLSLPRSRTQGCGGGAIRSGGGPCRRVSGYF